MSADKLFLFLPKKENSSIAYRIVGDSFFPDSFLLERCIDENRWVLVSKEESLVDLIITAIALWSGKKYDNSFYFSLEDIQDSGYDTSSLENDDLDTINYFVQTSEVVGESLRFAFEYACEEKIGLVKFKKEEQ
jgi:hypothetical protein